MSHVRNLLRAFLLVLATAVIATSSGCGPTDSDQPANSGNSPSENSTDEPGTDEGDPGASNNAEDSTNSNRVAINGDLSSVDWDSLVDQEVQVTGELIVVDTYDLARRGQVKVARNRLYIPTNRIDPNDADPNGNSFEGGSNVASVTAAQKLNDDGCFLLGDGLTEQNIFPPKLFPGLGTDYPTVRVGSSIAGVAGKVVRVEDRIVLVPDGPLQWEPYPRQQRPDVGEADVTVASFNVLNYFTTIDDGGNGARGADSDSELQRQEAKIVTAIIALEADVVGLMELENNRAAEEQLVTALNRKIGEDVFRGCSLPDGFESAPGGDNAIRVGIIYRADRVTPLGDVSMIENEAFNVARTPLVQSFQSNSTDNQFTVIVNHFKSKGGSSSADAANKDKGDGQGAYNVTRSAQSLAICNYVDGLGEGDPESRVLVIGDLNAYGQEDPIDAMRANGLVDLHERLNEGSDDRQENYSFIYYGQSGSLDHAMATESMAGDITGIATWHINADEPRFLDYNQEFNPESLFDADPFRSSDHDPVLIGIGN
ncbi:MAG: ExeM/NucH family extracellular endonuclease [Planctomycetota bacterium]